jgi:hypothetical protein
MAGTSKLQSIEDGMVSLIEAMDAVSYNYLWGSCNQRDMAKQTWPNAVIYFEEEECLDEEDGSWCGAYYLGVKFRIEVRARLDAEYANPVVEIRKELYKCLDDLKMLFGRNWNVNGTCDTIMFKGASIVEEASSDIFLPSKLIVNFYVRYECDREDPTITAQ